MQLILNNKEKQTLVSALDLYKPTDKSMTKKIESLRKKILRSQLKIKPRSAKNKGLEYQKKISHVIGDLIGIEVSQDDDSLILSRLSGQNGTDIILRGRAKELFPYSVECKNCSSISLPSWISQAKSNSTEEFPWMLFIHSNILEDSDIVVMNVGTFEKIYSDKMKGRMNED